MSSDNKSTFGATSGSLFGQQNTPFGSVFGSTAAPTGTSAFGQTNSPFSFQQPQATSSVFGSSQQANNNSGSAPIFGSKPVFGPKPSPFGSSTAPQKSNRLDGSSCGPFVPQQPQAKCSVFASSTNQQIGTTVKFNPLIDTDSIMKNGLVVTIQTMSFCITSMKEYENKSLEELRIEDYMANRKVPAAGSTSGVFGSSIQNRLQTGSLFGGSTQMQTSLFAGATLSSFYNAPQQSGLLFGSKPTVARGSLFGNTSVSVNPFRTSSNHGVGQVETIRASENPYLKLVDDISSTLCSLAGFVMPGGSALFQQALDLTEDIKRQLEKEQSGSHLPKAARRQSKIKETLNSTPQPASNLNGEELPPFAEGINESGIGVDDSRNPDSGSETAQILPQESVALPQEQHLEHVAAKESNGDEENSEEKVDEVVNIVSSVSSQPNDFALKENGGETSSPQSRDSRNDESGSIYNKRSLLELWKLSDDSSHHEAVVDLMKSRSFDLHISSLKKSDMSDEIIVSTTDLDIPEQCESFSLCDIDYSDKKECYMFAESLNSLIKFCCYGRLNNITFEPDTIRPNIEFFSNYMSSIFPSHDADHKILPVKISSAMKYVEKMDGSAIGCAGLLNMVTPSHLKLICFIYDVSQSLAVFTTPGAMAAKSVIIEFETILNGCVNIDDCILKLSAPSIIAGVSASWLKSDKGFPIRMTADGLTKFIEEWLNGQRAINRTHIEMSCHADPAHRTNDHKGKLADLHKVMVAESLHVQLQVLEAVHKLSMSKRLRGSAKKLMKTLDTEHFNSRQDFVFDGKSRFLKVRRADGKKLAVVIRSSASKSLDVMAVDMFPLN